MYYKRAPRLREMLDVLFNVAATGIKLMPLGVGGLKDFVKKAVLREHGRPNGPSRNDYN